MSEQLPVEYPSRNLSRRRFLRIALGSVAGLGTTAIGASAYVTRIEPYRLDITRIVVPLPNLPAAFDGYTIAQISDWHLGEWMMLDQMLAVAAQVNRLHPDLITITGDYVSMIWQDTADEITLILGSLQALDGVVTVLGNHDHWTHAPTIREAILASHAKLLTNQHMVIQHEASRLYIAGVDDIWERQHDLPAALDGIPEQAATILLAHEPDFADQAAATRQVGLQLSGHSHGGQVRLPGKGALILPYLGEKYDSGLYQLGEMYLYVNRGVGMVAPHVRFNCPPEITLLTLSAEAPV